MGIKTSISWADHTFNPWIGCSKVSEGCRHCYAEQFALKRMRLNVWGLGADRHPTKTWRDPVKWNRQADCDGVRRRVFCASLADVFEDHVTANNLRPRLWNLIRECASLDWLLLTKRPENIRSMLPCDWGNGWGNVWLGTTIEDDSVAYRLNELRSVPSVIRFVSYEPALGPIDQSDLSGVDWLIYGGESGPGYRPDNPDWARAIRDRCRALGIAFFYKQGASLRSGQIAELDGETIQEIPQESKGGAT